MEVVMTCSNAVPARRVFDPVWLGSGVTVRLACLRVIFATARSPGQSFQVWV